jgi:hypothetical protein
MAKSPMPESVRRGVIKPPNEAGPGGNRAANGYLPLGGSASPGIPSNLGGGDHRNGSAPLGGVASPVHIPDHRFNVDTAKMPQPASAIEPGKGAIPVNPWDAQGKPNRAVSEPDADKPPRR